MAEKEIEIMENFNKNIFVNCPFDDEYKPLLKSLLFTILYCDFNPRIALERFDSGEARFSKIKELIDSSIFSIHDLSRIKSKKLDEYYRLNMPFEIGLDLGCRLYNSDPKYRTKKTLILETEKYSYQKALSDLSNSDVKCHDGESEELIYQIRNWFYELIDNKDSIQGASIIWDDYNIFNTDLFKEFQDKGLSQKDIDKMSIAELQRKMVNWIEIKKRERESILKSKIKSTLKTKALIAS